MYPVAQGDCCTSEPIDDKTHRRQQQSPLDRIREVDRVDFPFFHVLSTVDGTYFHINQMEVL